MGNWRRVAISLLIIAIVFANGCYPHSFKQQVFFTDYTPQKVPKQIPDWWKANLNQYLHLSYINMGDKSAFGLLGGDVFSPNLYATYAVVGILNSLSYSIEEPSPVVKWIQSLQNRKGIYYDKDTLAEPIEQTYWAISTLKRLNVSPPNSRDILLFLKNHEQGNGLFMFEDSKTEKSMESCISQTYFAISILHLLDMPPDNVSKTLNLKALSKTLQTYIGNHLSSTVPLNSKESGYLISAIYELSYINKNLVPKKAYNWMSEKIQEIKTLPYGVQYVALINNLFEAMRSLGITPQDVSSVDNYLKQKVFPMQNENEGFGFGEGNSNFIEPMVTYEVVRLFKLSSISRYPNLDTLIKTLKIHCVKNGWIKFITFEPSVVGTYYAVSLAELNGNIKEYPMNKLIKYLTDEIEDVAKSTAAYKNSNGVLIIKDSEVNEKLKNLYYAVRTYTVLKKRLPVALRSKVIDTAKTLVNVLPPAVTESEWAMYAEALSYFISTFNTLQIWPSDSSGLLDKIEDTVNKLASSVREKKAFDIQTLYNFFVLNSVLEFYYGKYGQKADENVHTIENALATLNVGSGFKRFPEINIPDVHSTYLGLWLEASISGNIKLDIEKTIKFVIASQAEYGFYYVPHKSSSGSDLRVTYEALWILDYLTNGIKYNFSEQG